MIKKIKKSRVVYKGIFVNIRHDHVMINGKSCLREIVQSKEGVLIAAINDRREIILIRQHRHNLGDIYEVPAGAIKDQEEPLEAAKRELLEETGFAAKYWKLLSKHHNGVHNEGFNYFFMAQGLKKQKRSLDPDEEIYNFEFFSFHKALELIDENHIPDLRNRACIWRAYLELLNKD